MDFEFDDQDMGRFREEIRQVVNEAKTLAKKSGVLEEFPHGMWSKIGEKRWHGMAIPKKYGGAGYSLMDKAVFLEEINLIGAPETFRIINYITSLVAELLLEYGTDVQKNTFLPKLCTGEMRVAGGSTEPNCGSDTAAIETTARKKGNSYVINGTKIYSDAHLANYMRVSAITDPSAKKQERISHILVDLKSSGVSIRPLVLMWGERRNEVVFEDVAVPQINLIGEENRGFHYTFDFLEAREWAALGNVGSIQRNFDRIVKVMSETQREGKLLKDIPSVRQKMADIAKGIQIGRLLFYRAHWELQHGERGKTQAAMAKLYTSQLVQRLADVVTEVFGRYSQLRWSDAYGRWVPDRGRIPVMNMASLAATIGGYTTEMQREFIAVEGLGLPEN